MLLRNCPHFAPSLSKLTHCCRKVYDHTVRPIIPDAYFEAFLTLTTYPREIDTRSCPPTRPRLAQHGHTKTLKLLFPSRNDFEAIFSSAYKWEMSVHWLEWYSWAVLITFEFRLTSANFSITNLTLALLKPVRIIQVLVLISMTSTCLVWKLQELLCRL